MKPRSAGHPQLIRPGCRTLPIHAVQRARHSRIRARRLHRLAPHGAAQSLLTHEAFDGATRNGNAFSIELSPDLVRTIDLQIDLPDALDLTDQFLVAPGASTTQFRIAPLRRMAPVRRRGNQNAPLG